MGKRITTKVIQGNKPGEYKGRDGLVLRIRATKTGTSKSWVFKKFAQGTLHR